MPCRVGCRPETAAPEITPSTAQDESTQKELVGLARALHNAAPKAYENLAAFAASNATNVWGARAALALGYDDYSKDRDKQALAWFEKAKPDTLLREYVLYCTALAEIKLKHTAQALTDLQTIDQEFPNSAIKEQVLAALAPAADQLGRPQDALEALNSYPITPSRTPLLLLRAQAYQAAHQLARAAKDYQTLYYRYSQSDEAAAAGPALPRLMHELRKEYPYPGVEAQQQRAQAFFDAHQWKEARAEFEKLLGMLQEPANPNRQLAQLRIAQARVELRASPRLVASLKTPDPEVDAERLYVLSQIYRTDKKFDNMLSTLDALSQKYPQSKWNEEGLMAEGNYYWVELDRTRAASYYQKVLDQFPGGKNAFNAEWRIAWVAYLNRQPDAADRLTAFLVKYPSSSNDPDILYWLGRIAERAGNTALAKAYDQKAAQRFPQTYFGHQAALRLATLPHGDGDPPEFLEKIPPPPALRPFDEPIPVAAADRWERAQALRSIAFDAFAELELKSAFFATASPRFLYEAAQAAFDQGHFAAGMNYGRIIIPNFEARKIEEIPLDVWRVLYPLPYEEALRREAAKNGLDPMLVAGLIRQESTFQSDALSYADAYGLMQLLPKTGRKMARALRVRYATKKLYDPDYNIELGCRYFRGLIDLTGAPAYALAAYNAGEDRIAAWKAERNYEEVPELVESIPFTQTREYVEVVLRNAELYRMIYNQPAAPAVPTVTASGHVR